MEQMTQSAGARAQFVLTDAYAREMYRSIRPRVLIILGIVFFVPVLVYCITKIAWRALFSYVTGAAFLEGVSMWLAVALLLAYLVGFIWLLFAPRRCTSRCVIVCAAARAGASSFAPLHEQVRHRLRRCTSRCVAACASLP